MPAVTVADRATPGAGCAGCPVRRLRRVRQAGSWRCVAARARRAGRRRSCQTWHWTRVRGDAPGRWLERRAGRDPLSCSRGPAPPVPARLRARNPAARPLGFPRRRIRRIGTRATRIRCWLTPLDVPRDQSATLEHRPTGERARGVAVTGRPVTLAWPCQRMPNFPPPDESMKSREIRGRRRAAAAGRRSSRATSNSCGGPSATNAVRSTCWCSSINTRSSSWWRGCYAIRPRPRTWPRKPS